MRFQPCMTRVDHRLWWWRKSPKTRFFVWFPHYPHLLTHLAKADPNSTLCTCPMVNYIQICLNWGNRTILRKVMAVSIFSRFTYFWPQNLFFLNFSMEVLRSDSKFSWLESLDPMHCNEVWLDSHNRMVRSKTRNQFFGVGRIAHRSDRT
jgi:hypothetical protein